jgi:hypothetical protein
LIQKNQEKHADQGPTVCVAQQRETESEGERERETERETKTTAPSPFLYVMEVCA